MSEVTEVTISVTGHGRGEVRINDKKIPRVKSVTFTSKVNSANTVMLELVPDKITCDGVVRVTTIEDTEHRWATGRRKVELPVEWRLKYD